MARKNDNGNGYIRKLPSGNWRGQLMDGYRPDGKRNVLSFTAKTKAEVRDKIRHYWSEKERGEVAEGRETPFSVWADTWYADYKTKVQPSTYFNYQYTLKILKDYFGKTPTGSIKPMDLNRFYDHLRSQNMSKSYMRKCRAMLIQIFDAAVVNNVSYSNPARNSKPIKTVATLEDEEENKKDAFTEEEQDLLMKFLPDNLTGHTIRVMLGTGTRSQEILAVNPENIAEDGSSISINKAIKMVGGMPTLGPTKSKMGKRVIPVPADYQADARYLRENAGTPYVWTSGRESGLFDIGSFRRRYYNAIKKVPGVRPLSPHCCRHTYITNLEKRGVAMEQIARLAGHSHIDTTDDYLHIDMETLSNAVVVLNKHTA